MSSEQNFGLLMDTSPDAIVIYDNKGNVSYVNQAFTEIFGWTQAELVGKPLDFVPEESHEQTEQFIAAILAGESVKVAHTRRFTKDGRIIDIQLSANMARDEDGTPLHTFVIFRDITQQRQVIKEQEHLLQSEQQQRIIAETLSDVAMAVTSHTNLQATLDEILIQAQRLVSYTTANIALLDENSLHTVGWRGYEAIGREDFVTNVVQSLDEIPASAQAIQSGKPLLVTDITEYPTVTTNEQTNWIRSFIGVPLTLKDKVVGMLRVNHEQANGFSDEDVVRLLPLAQAAAIAIENTRLYEQAQAEIEKRKKIENDLERLVVARTADYQKSQQQVTSLIQLSPTGIIEWDEEFRVKEWNPGATQIFGYSLAEAQGQHASFIIPEVVRPLIDDIWQHLLSQTGGTHSTNENLTKDGRLILCNWFNTPITDENGQVIGVASFIEDITESHHAKTELAKREQLLNILNRLAREASFTLDLGTTLNQVCQSVTEIFNSTSAYVSGYNLEDGTLTILAEYLSEAASEKESESDWGVTYNMEDEFGYTAEQVPAMQKTAIYHVDDDNSPAKERAHLAKFGIYSSLSAQLHHQGKAIGLIEIYESRSRRDFTNDEIEALTAIANQLSITIDNVNLYNQLTIELTERKHLEEEVQDSLSRREREMRFLTQFAQEITLSSNLNDLYNRLVTLIKEQFNYYYVQLFRYNPTLNTAELVVGYGEIGERLVSMHHSVPLDVGLVGKAIASKETILVPDVAQEASWQPNPYLIRTRGEIAVPIKLLDQVLGVLDVQSEIVNALNENDQILLEGVSGQIAVAIESANLRQEMADRLRELGNLQQLMTREGWQEYQTSESITAPGYIYSRTEIQPLTATAPTNGSASSDNGHAAIVQPLTVRGMTIGTLGIEEDLERPLNQEDQLFLNAITEQVAEALEIARLLDTTQEALTTQERLSTELRTVAEVSTVASTIMERNRLLQNVVDLTKDRFDLYHAHIYLFEEANDTLSLVAGADQVGRLMTLEENHIPLRANAIVALAARLREAIVENDTRKATGFLPHPLLPRTRSELAAPMIVGERLVGVLDVQSDVVNRFAEQDILIMRTLASQVAVAVQNAEQYAEQVETAEKLREVEKLKSEFLASMSHELRTPLNSIIGFADVLLEGLDGPLNERMEQDVRLIRDSGDHLRSLIGDILDMTKIEAGKMELRYEEIDMSQLAQDVIATATPLVQDKGLRLHLTLAQDIFNVHADRTRLRQILWNIMGNAIKFTAKGNIILSVQTQDENLLVSIRDTGIGIAPENIPIVFEQFRQIDGSLNRTAEGTGLGMPITKKLVELHGGDIWVESVVGEGSTFWFTIPRFPISLSNIQI